MSICARNVIYSIRTLLFLVCLMVARSQQTNCRCFWHQDSVSCKCFKLQHTVYPFIFCFCSSSVALIVTCGDFICRRVIELFVSVDVLILFVCPKGNMPGNLAKGRQMQSRGRLRASKQHKRWKKQHRVENVKKKSPFANVLCGGRLFVWPRGCTQWLVNERM